MRSGDAKYAAKHARPLSGQSIRSENKSNRIYEARAAHDRRAAKAAAESAIETSPDSLLLFRQTTLNDVRRDTIRE
jgi:hypothetical protein